MKIAIVGYGKMGKMIERIALERGHGIGLRLDEFNNANYEGMTAENFAGIDVAKSTMFAKLWSRTRSGWFGARTTRLE